ncbi:HAD family hydrolase [Maribellus sp. CM-23]|uniref:HAD family hydrolase n=1 Tax=Maribellus sp. CM-23 TaxID=2781026 RepID=UPI00293ED958|nr:HAD family hydrolase [Maribellus sp. CM-23]MCE4566041.1 HAD family hydrolase [Maribellus sp. CM-23]
MLFIFDLDQTLIDSKIALNLRSQRRWSDVYRLIPRMKPYPMIMETLDYISTNRHKIAIVSTAPRPYCERVVTHFKFHVDVIIGYHDTTKRKPNPDPMIKALGECGYTNTNSISFGDRDIDIISAKRAGILACGCYWDSDNPEQLRASEPHLSFDTVKSMYDYINSNH